MRDMWFSAFHQNDRINVSTPFARRLGFQDAVLPFSLMLFLSGAMTHADSAIVQAGYSDASYTWPAFAKDTFKRRFQLKSTRDTSEGLKLTVFTCQLINQRGRVVFSTDKTMLFLNPESAKNEPIRLPTPPPPIVESRDETDTPTSMWLRQHIVDSSIRLAAIGDSQSLTPLRPGNLLLHSTMRPLSATQSMQLSSLVRCSRIPWRLSYALYLTCAVLQARLTHPRHFHHHVFDVDGVLPA